MHFQGEIVNFFLKNEALRTKSVKKSFSTQHMSLLLVITENSNPYNLLKVNSLRTREFIPKIKLGGHKLKIYKNYTSAIRLYIEFT